MIRRVISLVIPLGLVLACGTTSPVAPGRPSEQPAPTPVPTLVIATTYPRVGPIGGGTPLTITGFGFHPDASVLLGSVPASVTSSSGRQIVVKTPGHAPGSVDVVVTNPGGETTSLPAGFQYAVFELTVSATEVAPGGSVSVSWVGVRHDALDWIGLFKVGDPNTKYGWYEYTNLATTGTFTLTAPLELGEYEFRYLLDDDYIDVARSSPLRVR
jgi:hypothetical protein